MIYSKTRLAQNDLSVVSLVQFLYLQHWTCHDVSLEEGFRGHVEFEAGCQMRQNRVHRVARLLSCDSKEFLQRPRDSRHY